MSKIVGRVTLIRCTFYNWSWPTLLGTVQIHRCLQKNVQVLVNRLENKAYPGKCGREQSLSRKVWLDNMTQNIDCGYSLEPPRWGGSNEYPQSMSRHDLNSVDWVAKLQTKWNEQGEFAFLRRHYCVTAFYDKYPLRVLDKSRVAWPQAHMVVDVQLVKMLLLMGK